MGDVEDRLLKLEEWAQLTVKQLPEELQTEIETRRKLGGNLSDRIDNLEAQVKHLGSERLTQIANETINRIAHLERQWVEIMQILDRCGIALSELLHWRDTGAIHRQCKSCEQFLPVDRAGRFPRHFGHLGQCINSGGEA